MSFLDCINTAVSTGRLSQKKADEVAGIFEEHRARNEEAGLFDAVLENKSAMDALKETTELTYNKRWERINELKTQHANYTEIMNATSLTNLLSNRGPWSSFRMDSLLKRADDTYGAVSAQIMVEMDRVAAAFNSRALGFIRPLENMDNIVRYLYDEVVEPAAKILGEQVKAGYALMAKLQNLEGAHIFENIKFRLSQVHDRFKVREAGMHTWVADHLADGILDWDSMRYHNKEIPVDARQGILEKVWHSIVTEGKDQVKAAQATGLSMASRVSRRRFLLYANADAWLKMNEKYGEGNVYEQLLSNVESTSRHVSLMRIFGPNPANGVEFVKRAMTERLAQLSVGKTGKQYEKLRTSLAREIKAFDDQYAIMSHSVDTGSGDTVVQTINSIRSLVGTAYTGGVAVVSLQDAFWGMATRQMLRMPVLQVIPTYIHGILHFKDMKQQLINEAISIETMFSMVHDSQRYTMGAEGSHFSRMVSQANYRITGAERINMIGRWAMGNDLSKEFARYRNTSFDKIPWAKDLANLGITSHDWNLVRETPLYEVPYYSFGTAQRLRPIDMFEHAGNEEARAAANKFLTAQEALVKTAVPSYDLGSRAMLGGALSGRTFPGQFMKTASQLAIFPAAILFNHWKLAMSIPGAWEKSRRLGILFGYTLAGGAIVQQIKEKLKGNDMAPMDNKEFWIKSAVMGGFGGIIGDWLYNNVAGVNHPSTTPIGQLVSNTTDLVVEPLKWAWGEAHDDEVLKHNSHPGRAALNFAAGISPKPIQFRLAAERMIYDPLLQHTDPAAYARMVAAANQKRTEKGQTAWWPAEQ